MKKDKYRGAKIICVIAALFYIIIGVAAMKGYQMSRMSTGTEDLFGGYGSFFFGSRESFSDGSDISIDYGGLTEESTEISEEEAQEPDKAASSEASEASEEKTGSSASSEGSEAADDSASSAVTEEEDGEAGEPELKEVKEEEKTDTSEAEAEADTSEAEPEADTEADTEGGASEGTTDEYYSFIVHTGGARLNMRTAPDIEARIITTLNQGDTGYVLEIGDDWSKVVSGSFTGYCSNASLNMQPVSKEEYEEGTKEQP